MLRRSFRRMKRQCTLRCKSLPNSSYLDEQLRSPEPSETESESHQSSVHCFGSRAGSVEDITVSSSAFNARLASRDSELVQVRTGKHALAAVFTARSGDPTPGLAFLKAKLLLHLQIQTRIHAGKPSAVAAAFATLTSAFQWLPVQADVFHNLDLSLAYLDLEDGVVYTGCLGQCQPAVYSRSQHSTKAGRETDSAEQQQGPQSFPLPSPKWAQSAEPRTLQAQAFPLDRDMDGIVLGSAGFWHEVTPGKALLRLHHHTQQAPAASDRNPALHLTNFALHNVSRRERCAAPHPCAPDLSSVAALQSLWVGSADEEGHSPAHIRYRGDVHGDMNAIVVQIRHTGTDASRQTLARSTASSLNSDHSRAAQQGGRRSAAKQRWAFLRMHFRTFAAASRRQTLQRWHEVVSAAQAAAKEAEEAQVMKLQAAEAFLFGGSPVGSLLWPQGMLKALGADSTESPLCSQDAQNLAMNLFRPSVDIAAGV